MTQHPIRLSLAMLVASAVCMGQSNIDTTNKFGWGENVGWTNWRDSDGANAGVSVNAMFMDGFIWAENVGFINVGDGTPGNGFSYGNLDGGDFGVNIDPNGDLHGFAWGENIGWINFDGGGLANPPLPARIECAPGPNGETQSRLTGYAWGENVGWINLDDTVHYVSLTISATPVECDMNHDGVVDGLDIQPFTDFVLMNSTPGWADVCSGDVEAVPDQAIDIDDIGEFVLCLLN